MVGVYVCPDLTENMFGFAFSQTVSVISLLDVIVEITYVWTAIFCSKNVKINSFENNYLKDRPITRYSLVRVSMT